MTRHVLNVYRVHASCIEKSYRALQVRVVRRSTPPQMGVNSMSFGSPHVHPMWAFSSCGEPNEIKKNTHPTNITALFRVQDLNLDFAGVASWLLVDRNYYRMGNTIPLVSLGWPHASRPHMGHVCGEANTTWCRTGRGG